MPKTMLPSHSSASRHSPARRRRSVATSSDRSASGMAGVIGPALHEAEFAGRIARSIRRSRRPRWWRVDTSEDQQQGVAGREDVQHEVSDPVSAEILDDEIERDQGRRRKRGDEAQAPLDEVADRLAEAAQRPGQREEPRAAGDDAGDDEEDEADLRHAGQDGDHLDRRQMRRGPR